MRMRVRAKRRTSNSRQASFDHSKEVCFMSLSSVQLSQVKSNQGLGGVFN